MSDREAAIREGEQSWYEAIFHANANQAEVIGWHGESEEIRAWCRLTHTNLESE